MDKDILAIINLIAKLPGLGPKSARRLVLYLLQNKKQFMQPILGTMLTLEKTISNCSICGNLDKNSPCSLCTNPKRDRTLLCVVEEVIDVWALERGGIYKGVYHVLGGKLSAIDGIGPEELNITSLKKRLEGGGVKEIIFAVGTTVEGQITANYIVKFIRSFSKVKLSALANGIPMGGEIDYLDEGTLSIALNSRRNYI